jgi:hypothetical protein
MTMQCLAAGCIKPATDEGYRDGKLLWAACDEHQRAMQPKVDHRGRTLTIAGRMLLETATAAVFYRFRLQAAVLDETQNFDFEEVAEEVLEALCGTPPMRGLLHTYLTEIEESRGAA